MIAYRSHKMVVTSWTADTPSMTVTIEVDIGVLNSGWPLRVKNEWTVKAKMPARASTRESILPASGACSTCIRP